MYTPLTESQVEQFNGEGYLLLEHVLSNDVLQLVIDEINQEIDRKASELVAAGKLSQRYEHDDFGRRFVRINSKAEELATSIWNGVLYGLEIVASSVYRIRPKLPDHTGQDVRTPVTQPAAITTPGFTGDGRSTEKRRIHYRGQQRLRSRRFFP